MLKKGNAFMFLSGLCIVNMGLYLIKLLFLPAILFGVLALVAYFKASGGFFKKRTR